MKALTGPLLIIAAAITWCGSALMLARNEGLAWVGIFAAALLVAPACASWPTTAGGKTSA